MIQNDIKRMILAIAFTITALLIWWAIEYGIIMIVIYQLKELIK